MIFRQYMNSIFLLLLVLFGFSCSPSGNADEDAAGEDAPELVVKKRADGTISSVNQVVDGNMVHGVRVCYYEDGKTLYSKQSYEYGIKQGPATWYYLDGHVFKQTNFKNGKRQGLTKIYYKNGNLLAEFESDKGIVLPGLKEYTIEGELITSYPGIEFREIDHLASSQRMDLEISCTKRRSGVKFYILQDENKVGDRVYLITEQDKALMQFYVRPGQVLNKKVHILAEVPTELGNVLSRTYSYQLSAAN
jgi:hypothetical protein